MLNRQKLLTFLQTIGNSIFHITWIKKNGEERSANARLKVKSKLKGTGKSASKLENSYITIWLMGKEQGYRNLNLATVKSIKTRGSTYTVTPEPIIETFDLTSTTQEISDNVIAYTT